ncbi:NUDIX domain-containing protein [Pseudomassariella vexata]|uniref:NUDIX domain-containing protein n=1 Tax=Pseudomassariella vexata TaxID=1141098 RepID=A0A1Y2E7S0_9PEZI|nr:NUDIX domain-containing protein [Pseudomassariella vexata]ORY67487.1 NUDIX domain-containing protein [Pseudomassariella vexata]
MAAYMWKTTVYPSDLFVESCGAILFDLSGPTKKVCLLHYGARDQWLLPKGRRNCNETRQAAAVREVREESGYACVLKPVTMATRAPSELEAANVRDAARTYDGLTEPFMLEVRDLGEGNGVKLVWWFVAELAGWDDDGPPAHGEAEAHFAPQFFECEMAMKRLTFQKDRDVLRKAIDLAESSGW